MKDTTARAPQRRCVPTLWRCCGWVSISISSPGYTLYDEAPATSWPLCKMPMPMTGSTRDEVVGGAEVVKQLAHRPIWSNDLR